MSLDFLPQLTSISGNDLLGWDRLWCPLGSQLELDGWHSVGFLRDPSSGLNINCKSLNDWSQFFAGVCVLCGSPGAGKSGAIKLWLNHLKCEEPETFIIAVTSADLGGAERFDQISSHPEFQKASSSGQQIVMVIDGFDRFPSDEGLPFQALAFTLSKLANRSRLKVMIGCRIRDWNHNRAAPLLQLWPPDDRPHALEICPLTRQQVDRALASRAIPSESFFRDLREHRLEATAHWPFSLRSVMDSYQSGGLKASLSEQYSNTINLLLNPAKRLDVIKLGRQRQLARRLATILVFGGKQGMVGSDLDSDAGLIQPDELLASAGLAREVNEQEVFSITGDDIHELCGTALFVAIRPATAQAPVPALGFTHHSYAELLAAEYIKPLSLENLISLLTVPSYGGKRVPPQLVEVASWLATLREDWFQYLLKTVPELLLRADGGQFSSEQKRQLTTALLQAVASWNAAALEETRLLNPSFNFDGLADCLRPIILNSEAPQLSRLFALEVVNECRLAELEADLWQLLESRNPTEPRHYVLHALHSILHNAELGKPSRDKLHAALIGDLGPDADDELKGLALRCLVPRWLSPGQVAAHLTIPKQEWFFGSYKLSINDLLPPLIAQNDVEEFLKVGAGKPSIFHLEMEGKPLAQAVLKIFATISAPTRMMKEAFAGWVARCIYRYASLPLTIGQDMLDGEAEKHGFIVDETVRNRWLGYFLEHSDLQPIPHYVTVMDVLHLQHFSLEQSLRKLENSPQPQRGFWTLAVRSVTYFAQDREANLLKLLRLYDEIPELRDVLGPCDEGFNIHETFARARERFDLEEADRKQKQRELRAQKRPSINRREWFDQTFARWREGDELVWMDFWKACASNEAATMWVWGGDFVSDWEGWKSLNEAEQVAVRCCAREYLIRHNDPNHDKADWEKTGWSEKGAGAVGLLLNESASDSPLEQAIAAKWIPAWLNDYSNVSTKAQAVAAKLYQFNPDAVLRTLHRLFLRENAAEHSCRSIGLLRDCWNEQLSAAFASWLSADDVGPMMLKTGVLFLASRDDNAATKLISDWLDKIKTVPCSEATRNVVHFCALFYTRGTLFSQVFTLIQAQQHPAATLSLLERHFEENEAPLLAATLQALTSSQLAALAVTMANAFPTSGLLGDNELEEADEVETDQEKDPERRARRLTSGSQHHEAYLFSRQVVARFAEIATPDEIELVRPQMPGPRSMELPFARVNALKLLSQSQWTPLTAASLIKLVQQGNSRLIRSNDDLSSFLVDKIREFGAAPWAKYHRPVWNENPAPPTPKVEEELSNRLKIWLDEHTAFIVNREVQPVELLANRLDLKVEIPGTPRLCVIIEVKKAENKDVEKDLQRQLVNTYLITGQETHGIYVVARFGHKQACLKGGTLAEMENRLSSIRTILTKPPGISVETLLMDLIHPYYATTSVKPKRSSKKKPQHQP